MARRKSQVQLETELENNRRIALGIGWLHTLRAFAKYGLFAWGFWCLQGAVIALAGRHTDANFVLKMIGSLHADQYIAYLFGGSGLAFGEFQRRLRMKTVERMEGKKSGEELKLDPRRSSSKLTKQGQTNPLDMP